MTAVRTESELAELRNGVPLVSRRRPGSPVTTVSVWLLAGSRHEDRPGLTHLAEHVLVQAIPPGRVRSALDEVESVGGELNAITSREHLVLYARVPTPDAPAALAALTDSITNTEFGAEVVAGELRVVEEELRLAAADPNDIVHDVFFDTAFPGHPLGRPVGGTSSSLDGVTAADLSGWAAGAVRADRIGVAVSGDLDPEAALAQLAEGPLGALRPGPPRSAQPAPPVAGGARSDFAMNSDTAAIILGGPAFSLTDPRLVVAEVAMELLAGGNSSTLLEEIRNRRGLSYDVWGLATGYWDTGVWRIGIATAPENLTEVLDLAGQLLRERVARGWTPAEVWRAARRVAGLLRLEAESSLDETLLLGRHNLVGGDPRWTVQRQLDALAEVTADQVGVCAEAMFTDPVVVSAGGVPPSDAAAAALLPEGGARI